MLSDLDGSAGDLGLVLASFTVARVLFVLVGGVWADRLPRRGVMLVCDGLRAAAQAFVAVGLIAGTLQLWMLMVASAVVGGAAAFFGPASTGLIPEITSRGRLQQANALISLSQSATFVFGPAVAGLLVVGVGSGWAFAIDAASFVASAVFLILLRPGSPSERAERQSFFADLVQGWREVTCRAWLWANFIGFSLGNFSSAVSSCSGHSSPSGNSAARAPGD